MIRVVVCAALFAAVSAFASGCGFTCKVQGTDEQFASCNDLQASFDAEKNRTTPPPDPAVLDDLNTCGSVNGCNIKQ